ncbi:MAG: BsaA family SipW-dependent biofilm matrix protein [Clostridiales bacterium]|nr:BsaA family SipW-dependent biofilm matrix protein [Clostridiales bacterium]
MLKRKNILKIFHSKKAALFGVLAVGLLSFGTTWAFYVNSSVLANPLSTASSGVTMVEEYNPDSSFLPGETVVKQVSFENTGDMDLLLRVEVPPAEAWLTSNGESTNLDTSYVLKTWSTAWGPLTGVNGDGETIYNEDGYDLSNASGQLDTSYWTAPFSEENASGDTVYYRYYKLVLKKNGTENDGDKTGNILESIKLSPEVSNDRHADDYSNKIYELTFNAEAVAVEEETQTGALSEWNMVATVTGDSVEWSRP